MSNTNPKEKEVRDFVAEYLQMQYPDAIYRFDLAADQKLSVGQAVRNKKLHPHTGYPDLFIAEPRNDYHGLFIEMKRKGAGTYLKDGSLSSRQHIQEQKEFLDNLEDRGYKAVFAVGIDRCQEIIDEYLT
jgi:hypothetical protein